MNANFLFEIREVARVKRLAERPALNNQKEPARPSNGQALLQFRIGVKTEFDEQVCALVPDLLWQGSSFDKHGERRGSAATFAAMRELALRFDTLLKENLDKRIALGGRLVFDRDKDLDDYLARFVMTLRLTIEEGEILRSMLGRIVRKHVPHRSTVKMMELLGNGGFAQVYAGTFNDRPVLINRLADTGTLAGDQAAFRHEMLLYGQTLDEPNLPGVVGIYYEDDKLLPTVVLDKVPEINVHEFIARQGTRLAKRGDRARVALHFLVGAVCALDALQKRIPNFIHRDIKPENIMVNENTCQACLIDHGTGGPVSNVPQNIVTPKFASNEHLNGHVWNRTTAQADVFSLGSTLYAILGGMLWEGAANPAMPWKGWPGQFPGKFDETDLASEPIWTEELQPVRALIEACWNRKSRHRPTIPQMMQAIRGEEMTIAVFGEVGLKKRNSLALDVLRPYHDLRKDAEALVRQLCK
jgi:hypothetical protein